VTAGRSAIVGMTPYSFTPRSVSGRHSFFRPRDDNTHTSRPLLRTRYFRSISASSPKTTARAALSSSRSISNSPKVRASRCPQNSPIGSARSKSREAEDVEELGSSRRGA
jgi:hypothetical protein